MRKIYPKIGEGKSGEEALREYIEKYKGVEIQYFHKDKDKLVDFLIEKPVEEIIKIHPNIEEIVVHPPLSNYDLEQIMIVDRNLIYKLLDDMIRLSNKYDKKINMVLHSNLDYSGHRFFTISELKKMAEHLKGTKVKILLENLLLYYDYELFPGLKICQEIDSENLKICIDMCHLYCRANMYKTDIEEFLKVFLDKELCKKYVHQIHFADTKNNDGYKDHATHGRTYDDIEKVKFDLNLLKQYGMEDKIIVTEVSEDDYTKRVDQIKTIKFLEEVYKQ